MIRLIKKLLGFAALEAELLALRCKVEAQGVLEDMALGNTRTTVRIGGLEADLLPLSTLEWAKATRELPSFLLVYAAKSLGNKDVSDNDLEQFVNTVRGWLRNCARIDGQPVSEAQLERLSVPEASLAATAVSAINGFDETLREFFRARAQLGTAGHRRETLRSAAEPTARIKSN